MCVFLMGSVDVDHWHCPPVVHLYISRRGLARPVWHPVNTALQTLCENPFLDLIGPCWLCSATIGQAPSRETVPLARGRHFGKLCFAQMTVLVLTQVDIFTKFCSICLCKNWENRVRDFVLCSTNQYLIFIVKTLTNRKTAKCIFTSIFIIF